MFRTIFTVQKKAGSWPRSVVHATYFESFDDAWKFANDEVRKVNAEYVYDKHSYLDGSFLHSWDFGHCEFLLHDNAWITDFRVNGIGFYDECGLLHEFPDMESFRKFIKHSQEI